MSTPPDPDQTPAPSRSGGWVPEKELLSLSQQNSVNVATPPPLAAAAGSKKKSFCICRCERRLEPRRCLTHGALRASIGGAGERGHFLDPAAEARPGGVISIATSTVNVATRGGPPRPFSEGPEIKSSQTLRRLLGNDGGGWVQEKQLLSSSLRETPGAPLNTHGSLPPARTSSSVRFSRFSGGPCRQHDAPRHVEDARRLKTHGSLPLPASSSDCE